MRACGNIFGLFVSFFVFIFISTVLHVQRFRNGMKMKTKKKTKIEGLLEF